MRRERDIHGLRSQVRTGDRLQELRRHAGSLSDELSPQTTADGGVRRCSVPPWPGRPGGSKAT